MGRAKTADDLAIAAPSGAAWMMARVIGVGENQAPTRALTAELAVTGGQVEAQGYVAQIALVAIAELRISVRGLIDVARFAVTELFVDKV